MSDLKVGDRIHFLNTETMIEAMTELEKEDVQTDFIIDEKGIWLVVVGTEPIEALTLDQVKEKMCDDYCKYTSGAGVNNIESICENCPLARYK